MKLDDRAFLRHIEAFTEFAARLAAAPVAIFAHQFDDLHFGSWLVVAGSRHRRVRLTWDGRADRANERRRLTLGSKCP